MKTPEDRASATKPKVIGSNPVSPALRIRRIALGYTQDLPEARDMFARILKGAPYGNQNAKGHGGTKAMSGKDVIKRMQKEGWEVSRVKGSHHIMKKAGFTPIPVPAHNDDLGIGLFKAIAKHTGISF